MGTLIVCQQTEVGNDRAIYRDPQFSAQRLSFRSGKRLWIESISVGAVWQRMDDVPSHTKFLVQHERSLARAGQNRLGQMIINPALNATYPAENGAVRVQEIMINHLAGQAALEIKYHGYAKQLGQQAPNQRPLMHVPMDDVRFESPGFDERLCR